MHCATLRFAVAIVQELPYGVDANTFATELIGKGMHHTVGVFKWKQRELHSDRWGLGHSKCHDGLLLLYVASDGGASLKWYVVLLEAILNAIDSTIFLFRKKGT